MHPPYTAHAPHRYVFAYSHLEQPAPTDEALAVTRSGHGWGWDVYDAEREHRRQGLGVIFDTETKHGVSLNHAKYSVNMQVYW
jgi:hypothetical protein